MFIADVDYVRSNKTVFTGTTAVGFVGVLNGVKRGGFSVSLDARKKGGKIDANVLQVRPGSNFQLFLSELLDSVCERLHSFVNACPLLSDAS